MTKANLTSACFLLILTLSCQEKDGLSADGHKADSLPAPSIDVEVLRVSDINFPDQQYAIRFWLSVDYSDTSKIIDFAKLIHIPDAKGQISVNQVYLTEDKANKEKNLMLEVNCLMEKNWNVTGYPFDDQVLNVEILSPQFDTSQLVFHTNEKPVSFLDKNSVGSGWIRYPNYTKKSVENKIFDSRANAVNSVFSFQIPIHRENPEFIFWKLFAGMYIAFLVSFVALFINIKHFEPRFGLPVGGLFATIANKYIIEDSLPLTAKLTLVDWLHDITIFSIFLIIAFSAVLLKLDDYKKHPEIPLNDERVLFIKLSSKKVLWIMEGIARIRPGTFLGIYILINAAMIILALNT